MEDESKEQKGKDRGLFKRGSSDHWWIRFADRNGRLIRESTGTTSKKLAREILAKKKALAAENRHLDVKKIPNALLPPCVRSPNPGDQNPRHRFEGFSPQ